MSVENACGEASSSTDADSIDSSVPVYHNEEWLRRHYWDKQMSTYEMGDIAGVSNRTIRYWMDKNDVEKRGNHKRTHAVTGKSPEDASKYKTKEWLQTQYVEEDRSVVEIADMAGVTPTTICNWMDAVGVETRGPHQRDHIIQSTASKQLSNESWLREKYEDEKLSTPKIAELVGRTQAAVAYWMRKHGVEWRDSKEAALRGEQHPDWDGGHSLEYGGEWIEQREKAIQRDNEQCRRCGVSRKEVQETTDRDLHVHHIRKLKRFDDLSEAHRLGNLITLCQNCHAALEGLPIDNR